MSTVRCNYCGQVVQFIPVRGNSVCPVCRQSSTSCCDGDSCLLPVKKLPAEVPKPERVIVNVVMNVKENVLG